MTAPISADPSRPIRGDVATARPLALLAAKAAVNLSLLLAGAGARGRSALARVRPLTAHRGFRAAAALGLVLMAVGAGAHHLYLDRTGVPDLEPFIRFEPPTIGEVSDARGEVLIELAREYRRILEYDEIPPVVREAILAAEDKNFFSHSGIDYGAFPRVVWKTLATSASASWRHSVAEHRLAPSVIFPQGGSTLTQQLVRGYFLRHMTVQEDGGTLIGDGLLAVTASKVLGVPATNKLARKIEEIRLTFWLEHEMERRFGSRQRAKQEILARYASFIYMGNGRYGFSAASEYYFAKPLFQLRAGGRGQGRAPGRHHQVAPRLRALSRKRGAPAAPAQRHPGPDGPQRRAGGRHRTPGPGHSGAPGRAQQDEDGGAGRRGERLHGAQGGPPRRRERGSAHRRAHQRPDDGGQPHPAPGQRRAGVGPARLRDAASEEPGPHPGLGGRAAQRGRRDPRRSGRPAGLQRPLHLLQRLQPRHGLAAAARLRDEADRVPGRLLPRRGPRRSTWPTSPSR